MFPAKRERIKETTKELWSPYNEYANLYFSKSAIFPFIPHVSLIWCIWSLVYIYFDFAKKLSFLIVSLTIFFVVFFIFEWAIGDKSWEYIQKFRQMPVKEKVVKCIIVYGYAFASLALLRYVLSSSELFISDVVAEQAQRIWRQMDRSCCLFSVSPFEKNRESCFSRTKKRGRRNIFSLFPDRTFFDFSYSFSAGSRGKLFVVYRLLLFFSATMTTFIAIVFVILLLVSLRIFSWATEQYNKTGKYIRKFSKKPIEEIREKAPFVYGYILVSWFVFALLLWLNIKWL